MNDQKLKVLFVSYEYGKNVQGGIARVINGLTGKLASKLDLDLLVDRTVYFDFDINLLLVNIYNFVKLRMYQVFQFRSQRFGWSYHTKLQSTLINLIRREKYDIIHLFHIGDFQETTVRLIRRNFPGIKIIYSCHSIAKYDLTLRNSLSNQLGYEYYLIHHIDHLHVLNQTSLQYLRQSYPSLEPPVTYSIIPNGIDDRCFQQKDASFERKLARLLKKDGWITVLCMSRWSYGKGLEYLLAAIPEVIQQNPKIQFVFAGRKQTSWESGFDSYKRTLDEKLKALKAQVVVFGWLNDFKRNALFEWADIWVMPSLLEYFPYSILEPMAAKIPIISARIDSVQEMLEENRECLFYSPQDSGQLAGRIVTLAQNPELRGNLAQAAYQKVKNQYQWESVVDKYLSMYRDALAGVVASKF